MKVNICGLQHEVVESEDVFDVDLHLGQINYKDLQIRINKNMAKEVKEETICHEMVHGILVHLGHSDLSNDEQFVQVLGNAIYQGFHIKDSESDSFTDDLLNQGYSKGIREKSAEILKIIQEGETNTEIGLKVTINRIYNSVWGHND